MAGNLLLFVLLNHHQGLGFTKERTTCIPLRRGTPAAECYGGEMTALVPAEPSYSSTHHLHPNPRTLGCLCWAGCPTIPLCSGKPHDCGAFNADFYSLIPPPILLLLQTLNCPRSSSSKEILVSYWTRNRKSSQGHLTCDVFVSKYQRP